MRIPTLLAVIFSCFWIRAGGRPLDLPPSTTGKPLKIGDYNNITISSIDAESDIKPSVASGGKFSKTYDISHPDASYLALHFSSMNLDPSCSMTITDAFGGQEYTMHGNGRLGLGKFWSQSIHGDSIKMTVSCNGQNKKADFKIDEYASGYPESFFTFSGNETITNDGVILERNRNLLRGSQQADIEDDSFDSSLHRDLSICEVDDKLNARCYEVSNPTEYNTAKAVARLIINGATACTGWLVGPNNRLFTNYHCIATASDAMNTDYQFMYEGNSCTSNTVSGYQVFSGLQLLKADQNKDYALIELTGSPASIYGYLDIENRLPTVGEEIYIPQHAGARDKELGIYDTHYGAGARCQVSTTSNGYCTGNGAYNDVRYTCDTEGGSSGSPVISFNSNKVVALHHCGSACGYGNTGVPVVQFYSEVKDLIYTTTATTPPPTMPPTLPPTPPPTSPPATWATIVNESFTNNIGTVFVDGGYNCRWVSLSKTSCNGCGSIELRYRGSSSNTYTRDQSVTYSQFRVNFSYYVTGGLVNGEAFYLEYSTNGGSSWGTPLLTMRKGTEFTVEGTWLQGTVEWTASASTIRLRFRSNFGTTSRKVYIDEVLFEGM